MAFKTVTSLDADVTVALGKKDKATGKPYPKSAEGYYLGSRTVENKRGESKLHFLQTNKGNLGVWGTMDLNRKLAQTEVGTMVRITSTGTKPTPNGDMYTYKVEVDAENTIEVNLAEGGSDDESLNAGADEDDDGGGNGVDENEEIGFEGNGADPDEEDQAQAMALAAAERKAKVQALLNKKGGAKSAKN